MSLRLEMLQVARLSQKPLAESASLVAEFLESQLNPCGAWNDRDSSPCLYYSVFGLESNLALQSPVDLDRLLQWLETFSGDTGDIDFVHLTCLARCLANYPESPSVETLREQVAAAIQNFESDDGGFHAEPNRTTGSAYGCFLALGASQDLKMPDLVSTDKLIGCLRSLEARDGGFGNEPGRPVGNTPASAAAITVLRCLEQPASKKNFKWLLSRAHKEGGFYATPTAPLPDLLSTAVALHALSSSTLDLRPIVEPCLDFIDSLWTNSGSFYGNWTEQVLDTEYTYYALLALGHLDVMSQQFDS